MDEGGGGSSGGEGEVAESDEDPDAGEGPRKRLCGVVVETRVVQDKKQVGSGEGAVGGMGEGAGGSSMGGATAGGQDSGLGDPPSSMRVRRWRGAPSKPCTTENLRDCPHKNRYV